MPPLALLGAAAALLLLLPLHLGERDRPDPRVEPVGEVLDEAEGVGGHGRGADVVERGVGHAVGDLGVKGEVEFFFGFLRFF